jgi:sulfur carrier protein
MERTIAINGESRVVDADNLAELLERLGYDQPRGLAVALNGRVVPRGEWATRTLDVGDAIEIVGAVQGG